MSIRKDVAHEIAAAIWEDEQRANDALYGTPDRPNPADPLVILLNGRMMGLQRARDIAEEVGGRDA